MNEGLDRYRGADLRALPGGRLEKGFAELQRAAEMLETERLRWLAEIERRGLFRRDGHLTAQAWLAARHRLSFPAATRQVRTARALAHMPITRQAMAKGQLSSSSVEVLVRAREDVPAAFHRAEATLVDAAGALPPRELRTVVDGWKEKVDASSAAREADRLRERRRLDVSPAPSGMVRVEGELEPDAGQCVITALRAVVDAEVKGGDPDEARTAAQRRVDALTEICGQWLDRADRRLVGGERPHVNVTVDLQTLTGGRGSPQLDDLGPVPAETARRMACDASVRRIVLGPGSEPLDVGRKTSVVPAALRRAVALRDRGCRFPGCDRPPSWCQAHHVVHWARGGTTALANLVLLCHRHHRLVHEGGFGMRSTDGRTVFSRPDGTPLDERAPP